MTQEQFRKRLISIVQISTTRPKEAAKSFLTLREKARKSAEASVSAWDLQDCIGFAAINLSRSGSLEQARKLELDLIENYRKEMRYVGHALANSISSVALTCYRLGRIEEGNKLAYEALEFFSRFPEPSSLIEQLGAELKKNSQMKISKK